jgi:hypothetical protein
MTAAEHEALQNHYQSEIDRLTAQRMELLRNIIALAREVVAAIPPLPDPAE